VTDGLIDRQTTLLEYTTAVDWAMRTFAKLQLWWRWGLLWNYFTQVESATEKVNLRCGLLPNYSCDDNSTICTITLDRHCAWAIATMWSGWCSFRAITVDWAMRPFCRVTAAMAMQPWMESRGWCRLLLNYFGLDHDIRVVYTNSSRRCGLLSNEKYILWNVVSAR